RVCSFFVHFVDCHNHLDARFARKANRLNSLRLNSIISRYNHNYDISELRTMFTQSRKSFVSRSVEEGNRSPVSLYLIGRNMLSDSTRFSLGHFGATNCVKQAGLAVVHMTHHCHHWWT